MQDVDFVSYSRESMSAVGLADAVSAAEDVVDSIASSIDDSQTRIKIKSAEIISSTGAAALSMAQDATQSAKNVLSDVEGVTTAFEALLASSTEALTTVRDDIVTSIIAEEAALPTFLGTVEASLNSARLEMQLSLNEDTIDQTALLIEDSQYLGGVQTQVTDLINAFIAKENSRAVVESNALNGALSAASSQNALDVATAVALEASRAAVSVTNALNFAITKAQTSTGTTTDDLAWFVCCFCVCFKGICVASTTHLALL